MALPKLLQKLFQNGGAGDKLRPDIVPITLNGNEPDANGNFTADQTGCLPLSGGTMTETIRFEETGGLAQLTNDCYTVVDGGQGWDQGARFEAFGKGVHGAGGCFKVWASDGTSRSELRGCPDGSLLYNDQKIVRLSESYYQNDDNWYRVYEDGFVMQAVSAVISVDLAQLQSKANLVPLLRRIDGFRGGIASVGGFAGVVVGDVSPANSDINACVVYVANLFPYQLISTLTLKVFVYGYLNK